MVQEMDTLGFLLSLYSHCINMLKGDAYQTGFQSGEAVCACNSRHTDHGRSS